MGSISAFEVATPFELDGVFFDGRTSARRIVRLSAGEKLDILQDGAVLASWDWADIGRADAAPGRLRLRCRSHAPLARLEFDGDAAGQAVLRLCPNLGGDYNDPRALLRIAGWSLAAGLSIFSLAWFGAPYVADRLAPMTPPRLENRIGATVENQVLSIFGSDSCAAPEGVAALQNLAERLQAQAGVTGATHVRVLRSKIVNAFALPGNRVFVMRGLIDAVESPDELAGVLAHELGHVKHHDGMRKLIQEGGGAFLFGLLFGDVTGSGAAIFATRSLFNAAYSREAETRADATAAEVLRGLGRSPEPLGIFLTRITGKAQGAEGALALLSSHPMSADRLAAMEAAKITPTAPELLSAEQWKALKAICGAKPAEKKIEGSLPVGVKPVKVSPVEAKLPPSALDHDFAKFSGKK